MDANSSRQDKETKIIPTLDGNYVEVPKRPEKRRRQVERALYIVGNLGLSAAVLALSEPVNNYRQNQYDND